MSYNIVVLGHEKGDPNAFRLEAEQKKRLKEEEEQAGRDLASRIEASEKLKE